MHTCSSIIFLWCVVLNKRVLNSNSIWKNEFENCFGKIKRKSFLPLPLAFGLLGANQPSASTLHSSFLSLTARRGPPIIPHLPPNRPLPLSFLFSRTTAPAPRSHFPTFPRISVSFVERPRPTRFLSTKAGRQSTLGYTYGSSLSVDGAQATNSMVTQDTDKLFIQVRPPRERNTYVLRLVVLICVERIICPKGAPLPLLI